MRDFGEHLARDLCQLCRATVLPERFDADLRELHDRQAHGPSFGADLGGDGVQGRRGANMNLEGTAPTNAELPKFAVI